MHRLLMEREDKLSREIEEYSHRLKFIQKDMKPPMLPPYLTQEDNPLKNRPVQRIPLPSAPMTDNYYLKYKVSLAGAIPAKVDLNNLGSVKILWSRQKQQEQEE